MSAVDEFRYECIRINDKIEQLREKQEQFVRSKTSALFDEEEVSLLQLEEQIKEKTSEIHRLFNRVHEIVVEIKNASIYKPRDKVLANVLQWQYREISHLSERLRNCQREHVNKLTEKEKYAEQFIVNFDEIDLKNEPEHLVHFPSSDSASFHNNLHQQQQQQQSQVQIDIEADNEYLRERDQEMATVLKSIVDLNHIFQEMNALLVNQGSLLDRIDYNLESVQMRVEEGAIQLSKAERSARTARKLKCIMILCGSIILALIIMAINS